jgi:hypothetical protein
VRGTGGGGPAVGNETVRVRGEAVQRRPGRGEGGAAVAGLRGVEVLAEVELLRVDGVALVGSVHVFIDLRSGEIAGQR